MGQPSVGSRRTCLGCRGTFPQETLVRFVRDPEGRIQVDYRRKFPGRGAYTCVGIDCIRTALTRRQFDRTFRTQVLPVDPADLVAEIRNQVYGRILSLIGIARKSRQLIMGSQLILDRLGREPIALVILAGDISTGIREKVVSKSRAVSVPIWESEDKASLGQLVGRAESSVLALLTGGVAKSILLELERYQHLSGVSE